MTESMLLSAFWSLLSSRLFTPIFIASILCHCCSAAVPMNDGVLAELLFVLLLFSPFVQHILFLKHHRNKMFMLLIVDWLKSWIPSTCRACGFLLFLWSKKDQLTFRFSYCSVSDFLSVSLVRSNYYHFLIIVFTMILVRSISLLPRYFGLLCFVTLLIALIIGICSLLGDCNGTFAYVLYCY